MKTLVIASGNAGKIREFQGLLQALPVSVQPQPEGLEVEETGTTFAANARLKAQAVAAATGEWALADDSGLTVQTMPREPLYPRFFFSLLRATGATWVPGG